MAKVAVATSTTALLAAAVGTEHVILQNMGSNTVWVNIGAAAAADTGIALLASSAPIVLTAKKKELDRVFNAIAETGSTNVHATRILKA